MVAGVLLFAFPALGQAHPASGPAAHTRPVVSHPDTKIAATDAVASIPPIHQPAKPATVEYTHGELRIEAENSSLAAILQQVSKETGLVVEGMNRDQRIYGRYGPATVSSTLSKLLNGTGFNYVILEGLPGHPPVKLLLNPGGSGAPGAVSSRPVVTADSNAPAATSTASATNPSAPVQPKTTQQIFDELRKLYPRK